MVILVIVFLAKILLLYERSVLLFGFLFKWEVIHSWWLHKGDSTFSDILVLPQPPLLSWTLLWLCCAVSVGQSPGYSAAPLLLRPVSFASYLPRQDFPVVSIIGGSKTQSLNPCMPSLAEQQSNFLCRELPVGNKNWPVNSTPFCYGMSGEAVIYIVSWKTVLWQASCCAWYGTTETGECTLSVASASAAFSSLLLPWN